MKHEYYKLMAAQCHLQAQALKVAAKAELVYPYEADPVKRELSSKVYLDCAEGYEDSAATYTRLAKESV